MQRITTDSAPAARLAYPLFDSAATRRIEHAGLAALPPNTLMQRAGLAVARLALAVAPHARTVWIACGPGNNGGDGLEAAVHLQGWGKSVVVTWLGDAEHAPADALAAWARARAAGVAFADTPPSPLAEQDLAIDALLGLGSTRPPAGRMAEWIVQMNAGGAAVLAVDQPTGLDADTGAATGGEVVHARHTLCLLTLKPGLFTGLGRDAAGQIWLDTLARDAGEAPSALLGTAPVPTTRAHASHKGSFGDLAVVGGAPGTTGAALLAASAALHGGAGRVFVALLQDGRDVQDGHSGPAALAAAYPELMLRQLDTLDLQHQTVVCGCGGSNAVAKALPRVLAEAPRLVIDADALNAIAADVTLQALLRARGTAERSSILTPHPLEAARLLGCGTTEVQADRLAAAQQLCQRFNCVVVLKGSGTVIAAPLHTPHINPTGNGLLATAGTGDVLAGFTGALLAAGRPAFEAACEAAYLHGQAADDWPAGRALTAGGLAAALSPPIHRSK